MMLRLEAIATRWRPSLVDAYAVNSVIVKRAHGNFHQVKMQLQKRYESVTKPM